MKIYIFRFLALLGVMTFFTGTSLFAKGTISGSYKFVVTGYDWGPAVNKVIVELDSKVKNIDKTDLEVTETKKWYSGNESDTFSRTVLDAYLSDEKGNKVDKKSKYFTIELYVSPNEGSPFLYNMETGLNDWTDPYFLTIKSKSDKFDIDGKAAEKIMTDVDKFQMDKYTDDNITLEYAYYSPQKDDKKNALVIWIHGLGEGGTDPSIAILGNKVTNLVSDETQKILGNAYVLTPQAPTFWMDNGSGDISKFDGTSMYDGVLMSLIKNFVDSHPDIDKNKIIVGGCSNGGFMTMRLLVLNPDYFAAAYPVCEPYWDSLLSDEMIESIKDIPIWFTNSIDDELVNPIEGCLKTYRRLIQAGAQDVHVSLFSTVVDMSGKYKTDEGKPYRYMGHWSWLYTLNNQCIDPLTGESIFEWAGKKEKN